MYLFPISVKRRENQMILLISILSCLFATHDSSIALYAYSLHNSCIDYVVQITIWK